MQRRRSTSVHLPQPNTCKLEPVSILAIWTHTAALLLFCCSAGRSQKNRQTCSKLLPSLPCWPSGPAPNQPSRTCSRRTSPPKSQTRQRRSTVWYATMSANVQTLLPSQSPGGLYSPSLVVEERIGVSKFGTKPQKVEMDHKHAHVNPPGASEHLRGVYSSNMQALRHSLQFNSTWTSKVLTSRLKSTLKFI